MDSGAWWATIHGVTESWSRLSVYTHSKIDVMVTHLSDVEGLDELVYVPIIM